MVIIIVAPANSLQLFSRETSNFSLPLFSNYLMATYLVQLVHHLIGFNHIIIFISSHTVRLPRKCATEFHFVLNNSINSEKRLNFKEKR